MSCNALVLALMSSSAIGEEVTPRTSVKIVTSPPGAPVSVDGQTVGNATPCTVTTESGLHLFQMDPDAANLSALELSDNGDSEPAPKSLTNDDRVLGMNLPSFAGGAASAALIISGVVPALASVLVLGAAVLFHQASVGRGAANA